MALAVECARKYAHGGKEVLVIDGNVVVENVIGVGVGGFELVFEVALRAQVHYILRLSHGLGGLGLLERGNGIGERLGCGVDLGLLGVIVGVDVLSAHKGLSELRPALGRIVVLDLGVGIVNRSLEGILVHNSRSAARDQHRQTALRRPGKAGGRGIGVELIDRGLGLEVVDRDFVAKGRIDLVAARLIARSEQIVGHGARLIPGNEAVTAKGHAAEAAGVIRVEHRTAIELAYKTGSVSESPIVVRGACRRPAHLHGTRACGGDRTVGARNRHRTRHAQILYRTSHALRQRLAVEHDAVALAIERTGHGLDLLASLKADIRRELHDSPGLDGGGQLIGKRDHHGLAGLGDARAACLLSIGILVVDVRRGGILPVRTQHGGKPLIGRRSNVGSCLVRRRLGAFSTRPLVRSETRLVGILGSIRLLRGLGLRLHSDLCHALGKCRRTRHRPDEQHRESSGSQALEHNVVSRHPFSFFREPAIEPWRRRRERRYPGSTKAHVSHLIGSKTHAQQHPL